MLTRKNRPKQRSVRQHSQRSYLSTDDKTVEAWRRKFLGIKRVGRPPIPAHVAALIVRLKRENPLWGSKRIRDELRRMGLKACRPTIKRILREHGFDPLRGRPQPSLEKYRSSARDMLWTLDYLSTEVGNGAKAHVLLIMDVFTREIIDLRAFPGEGATSEWTSRVFAEAMTKQKRKPLAVMHDHGGQFQGQFRRQMAVLDVEQRLTPPSQPVFNGAAERMVKSIRCEMLDHVVPANVFVLQWYLDQYAEYHRDRRPHQSLDGFTPTEFATRAKRSNVISFDEFKRHRVERTSYANGLLNTYHLTGPPVEKLAA